MERLSTGIPGFDKLVQGGFPADSIILIAGEPGAGKTIFSGNFLHQGVKNGEDVVYVSLENTRDRLLQDFEEVGLNFSSHEGDFRVLDMPLGDQIDIETMTNDLLEEVRARDASRLVLDSVTTMATIIPELSERMRFMTVLYRIFQKLGCTTIAVAELPRWSQEANPSLEEFISDGVIVFRNDLEEDNTSRELKISKLRGTDHSREAHRYEISESGFEIVDS